MKMIPRGLLSTVSGGASNDGSVVEGSSTGSTNSGEVSVSSGSGISSNSGGGGGWYDPAAVGGEGIIPNVTIHGSTTNGVEPVSIYEPGEAPWEGQYLGHWEEPPPPSYEHTAVDGALIANTGRLAGGAAAAIVEGALVGAEIGAFATPIGALVGVVVGAAVGIATYHVLQSDHPTAHFAP